MAETIVFGRTLILLPTSPAAPASIEYRRNQISGATTAIFTGGQQIYDWQQGYMEWSTIWPPMDADQAAEFEGFLLEAHGQGAVFQLGDPRRTSPRGSALVTGGGAHVNGVDQTGYFLSTTGWQPNETGLLLRGDYYQIGYRLYRVTKQVDSDAMGNATIKGWPPIRESPNGGNGSPPIFDPLILTNTKGLWCLKSNVDSWTQRDDRYYSLTFEIREAI